MTITKFYWSTLKMVLNNKYILSIPALSHQNKYVIDFKEKAKIFNSFFSEQCFLMNNSTKLPSTFLEKAEKIISSISFSSNDIAKIIRDLDPNKPRGPDMIIIRMLKICGVSISKPLEIIFRSYIKKGHFPSEWKKANVVPVHQKGDKEVSRNYRPVSLLPTCGKIFERCFIIISFNFTLKQPNII